MAVAIGQVVYLTGLRYKALGLKPPVRGIVVDINTQGIEVKTDEVEYEPVVYDDRQLFMHGTESFIFTCLKETDMIRGL